MPGAKPKSRRSRAWPAAPSRARKRRVGDQPADRRGEGGGVAGRNQKARLAVDEQLLDGAGPGGDARQPLARRLHQHIGQAVAVAVAGDPAGQREEIGGAQGRQDLGLGLRAAPGDAPGKAEALGLGLQVGQQRAAADMDEAPGQIRRQQGKGGQQVVVALLLHRPPDGEDDDGIGGLAPVAGRPRGCRGGEAGEVEAVMDQGHLAGRRMRASSDGQRRPPCR